MGNAASSQKKGKHVDVEDLKSLENEIEPLSDDKGVELPSSSTKDLPPPYPEEPPMTQEELVRKMLTLADAQYDRDIELGALVCALTGTTASAGSYYYCSPKDDAGLQDAIKKVLSTVQNLKHTFWNDTKDSAYARTISRNLCARLQEVIGKLERIFGEIAVLCERLRAIMEANKEGVPPQEGRTMKDIAKRLQVLAITLKICEIDVEREVRGQKRR